MISQRCRSQSKSNFTHDDANLLMKLGPAVAAAIGNIPGVVDVKPGIVLAGDALNIQVDRVKASLEGLDPDSYHANGF